MPRGSEALRNLDPIDSITVPLPFDIEAMILVTFYSVMISFEEERFIATLSLQVAAAVWHGDKLDFPDPARGQSQPTELHTTSFRWGQAA